MSMRFQHSDATGRRTSWHDCVSRSAGWSRTGVSSLPVNSRSSIRASGRTVPGCQRRWASRCEAPSASMNRLGGVTHAASIRVHRLTDPGPVARPEPIVDRSTTYPEAPRQLRLRGALFQIVLQQHPGLHPCIRAPTPLRWLRMGLCARGRAVRWSGPSGDTFPLFAGWLG